MEDKNKVMPDEAQPTEQGSMDPNQGQEQIDPKMKREIERYQALLSKILYEKKFLKNVTDSLSKTKPEMAVPEIALTTNKVAEGLLKENGKQPELPALISGAMFLTNELLTLGEAGQFWDQPINEQLVTTIFQSTVQKYIEKGLKDKTIDPVELQALVEPLMTEEDRALGLEAGAMGGVPPEANEVVAMEKYASDREQKAIKSTEDRMFNQMKKMQGQGQGQPQAQGQPQGQLAQVANQGGQ